MRINGEAVSAEASAGSRSMRSGSMSFDDGSTVTITSSAEDYTVTAVASFTMESGRLYTVVRVTGKGEAEFAVTPGSKFEVVSPVAIIGVRGTQFRVITDVNYAGVDLLSGSVEVWDRLTGSTTVYTAPATFYVGPVPAPPNLDYLCIHCKKRCRDGAHGQRCPLHVGKPENIGTAVCVECPRDCKPAEYLIVSGSHCKRFCPMHKDNAVMDPDPADNPVPLKLTLAHHKDATWKVTNPNSFKVYFVWEIVGAGSMTNNDVSGGSIRDIDVGDIYANAVRLTYHLPDLGVQTTEATR
jgi:hypothetical protein